MVESKGQVLWKIVKEEYEASFKPKDFDYSLTFDILHARYKKSAWGFKFLAIISIFILPVCAAWLFSIVGLSPKHNHINYYFCTSFELRYLLGIFFMIVYAKPINVLIRRLILGKQRHKEYTFYWQLRRTKFDDSAYELPNNIVFHTIPLIVGFVLLSDYNVQIDDKNIYFNRFVSLFEEKTYPLHQIQKISYTPQMTKDSLGHFAEIDIYELTMNDGFEWTFNTSEMTIDTTVFHFLSNKSGVKIDTIKEKQK